MEQTKQRNPTLDLIRIVATFFILAVHFFLNNGFYCQKVEGTEMFIMTLFRTTFLSCIPLFLMLTGYLMNRKKLSPKYYRGITKTIGIYLISSVICFLYKGIVKAEELTLSHLLGGILSFTAANYSWYIELYIGLFLIIPFINLMYHGLESKKQKQVLIQTLIILTALPSVINIWNFTELKFWDVSVKSTTVFPDWWINIWPITYYMIGCYLSEFNINMKKIMNILLLAVSILAFGALSYWRSYGKVFNWGEYQNSEGLLTLIVSTLIFILLLNINLDNISLRMKTVLAKISNLCLGIYLISYVSDEIVYKILNENVPIFMERFKYFLIVVPASFLISMILSYFMNLLNNISEKCIDKIINLFSKKEKKELSTISK